MTYIDWENWLEPENDSLIIINKKRLSRFNIKLMQLKQKIADVNESNLLAPSVYYGTRIIKDGNCNDEFIFFTLDLFKKISDKNSKKYLDLSTLIKFYYPEIISDWNKLIQFVPLVENDREIKISLHIFD